MKNIKKVLVSGVAALLAATNLVGATSCFGGGSGNGGNGGGGNFGDTNVEVVGYDGSEVTVTFYHTMGQTLRDVLNKHIKKFNELYPNITVDHSTKGDYPGLRDQVRTELNAGTAPSMAYCYPDHVALYNSSKATVVLDDFINSTATATTATGTDTLGLTAEQKADYIEGYYNEGAAYGDGKMYTMPFIKSTEVLYYNKTEFAKNGWTVPTTWDEMEA
ncbi:MAG: extracellular solute-binding protein, partial [Clostridia bacterium]|nr:extracellular solute-binding protein [Clostridia bacterium]